MIAPDALYKLEDTTEARAIRSAHTDERRTKPGLAATDPLPTRLAKHHLGMLLKGSGIEAKVAEERGYRTIRETEDLRKLGFADYQCRVPGLLIPQYGVDGKNAGHQYRPDDPRTDGKGKPVKYEHPTGTHQHLDVLPSAREKLKNPGESLYITEGSKKADALVGRGVCAISIGGVYGFRGRNEYGGLAALTDWEYVPVNGRDVYVALDSDVARNPKVREALIRLRRLLEKRGATVWIVYLPEGQDGEKVGVDDFLSSGGTISDLRALATTKLDDADDAPGLGGRNGVTATSSAAKPLSAQGDADDADDAGLRVLPEARAFPLGALPPVCRRLVSEGAKALGCPPDFLAGPMLAALGSAIGASRVIRIKSSWRESATVYVAVIADPGAKKTPAFQIVLEPIMRRQALLLKRYQEEKAEYEDKERAYEAERKKAVKEGRTPPRPPAPPTLESIFLSDTTVEALVSVLRDNPRGLLVCNDEISGWVRGLDQYKGGKGSDRQVYLSLWSNAPVRVDRKSAEPLLVPFPYVSLCGGIQPEVLPELIKGPSGSPSRDGMLDRFLLCYPAPASSRFAKADVSEGASSAYRSLYHRLRKLEPRTDEDKIPAPVEVRLTPEAEELFIRYHDALEEEKERPGFPSRLTGPWAKLIAYLARLALILAMCRGHERVEAEDVENAKKLVDYFASMTRRAHAGLYGEQPVDRLAADLHRFLLDRGGAWEGTATELFEQLDSDALPGRPDELSKKVLAIGSRSPILKVQSLPRTAKSRGLRITLEVASSASSASPGPEEPHTLAGNEDDATHADADGGVIGVTGGEEDGWVELEI